LSFQAMACHAVFHQQLLLQFHMVSVHAEGPAYVDN